MCLKFQKCFREDSPKNSSGKGQNLRLCGNRFIDEG